MLENSVFPFFFLPLEGDFFFFFIFYFLVVVVCFICVVVIIIVVLFSSPNLLYIQITNPEQRRIANPAEINMSELLLRG